MRLNKQATLELTASIFLVIAQENVDEIEALELLGFISTKYRRLRDFMYDCPCCEYAYIQGVIPIGYSPSPDLIRGCEHICPLDDLWPKGCEYSTSPYIGWISHSNTATEKSIYALTIAKFAGTLAGIWSTELEEIK